MITGLRRQDLRPGHLPMARARAARLCQQADDAGDAVQDAYRCRALRTTASSRPAEVSW
jgi:hypothetical protein